MNEQPAPSPNGANGRGTGGRFAPGWKGGPGNPHARRVARLRSALLKTVTPADMTAIVARMVADAKAGNVQAAREVLERTLGKPVADDTMERLTKLESILSTIYAGDKP